MFMGEFSFMALASVNSVRNASSSRRNDWVVVLVRLDFLFFVTGVTMMACFQRLVTGNDAIATVFSPLGSKVQNRIAIDIIQDLTQLAEGRHVERDPIVGDRAVR